MTLDPTSLGIGLVLGALLAGAPFLLFAARARDAFRSVSADALSANNQAFIALAEQHLGKLQEAAKGDFDLRSQSFENTVAPVGKTLEALNLHLAAVEKERAGTYGELKQHFALLNETHTALRGETGRLVQALRTPMGRGSWGEMQLERLLEMSGMQAGVHYERQVSASDGDRSGKPDIVVKLAGGKSIVIDAKTPMDAYITAIEAPDDHARAAFLKTHAGNVRDQMKKLAAKEYWKLFASSPEFVVMFMPSEGACASALQNDLGLIEAGMRDNVVIATPMTLFALLRTIVYGWRQEKLAENAAEIARLGAQLYERVGRLSGTYGDLGNALLKAVKAYNTNVNQIERQVLPTLRQLRDEHAVTGDAHIDPPEPVEEALRYFSAAEMMLAAEGGEA